MAVTTSTPPDTQGPAAPPEPRRQKRSAATVWLGVIAWIVGIAFFFPVFWMVLTSFKQETDAYTTTPKIIFQPTLEQYEGVFSAGVGPYLVNSVIATVFSTLLVLVLGIPAAFAVSLRPVKKTQDVLFFFISTKMLPVVAVIVPIYVVVNQIGMLDNIWTLVIQSTGVVMDVLILLVLFVLVGWYIIGYKLFYLQLPHSESEKFLKVFWRSKRLDAIYQCEEDLRRSPISQVF